MPPSGYDQLTSSHHDTVPLHGGLRRVSQLNTSPPTGKGGIRKAVREDRPGGNLHPKFGLSVEHQVGNTGCLTACLAARRHDLRGLRLRAHRRQRSRLLTACLADHCSPTWMPSPGGRSQISSEEGWLSGAPFCEKSLDLL